MAGGKKAVDSGHALKKEVLVLVRSLGLKADDEFKLGRRIWGSGRHIDVIAVQEGTRKMLGIECKYQGVAGTAQEKIVATIKDIDTWPIRGVVVFAGEGFTNDFKTYLLSTGKAIEIEDLEPWLRLYFGLDLDEE